MFGGRQILDSVLKWIGSERFWSDINRDMVLVFD